MRVKRFVSFGLAGANYCIPVDNVVEILRRETLLDVPRANPVVRGAISLRGDVIPVVDTRARFGMAEAGAGPRQRIIVVRHGRRSCGLLVDIVHEIVEMEEIELPATQRLPRGVHGMVRAAARSEDTLFPVIDLAAILTLPKEAHGGSTADGGGHV
jgi:purine-binding chemotaxis protein CheW